MFNAAPLKNKEKKLLTISCTAPSLKPCTPNASVTAQMPIASSEFMPLYETINLKFSSFWSPHNRRLLSPRIQPIARRYARVTTHRSRRLNRNRTQRRQPEATSQHQTLLCSRGTQPITDCLYLVSTASYSPYTPNTRTNFYSVSTFFQGHTERRRVIRCLRSIT